MSLVSFKSFSGWILCVIVCKMRSWMDLEIFEWSLWVLRRLLYIMLRFLGSFCRILLMLVLGWRKVFMVSLVYKKSLFVFLGIVFVMVCYCFLGMVELVRVFFIYLWMLLFIRVFLSCIRRVGNLWSGSFIWGIGLFVMKILIMFGC